MATAATRQRKYYEGMVHFRTIDGRVVAFAGPDPARRSGTMWAKLKPSSTSVSGAVLAGKPKPVSQAGKVSQVHSAKIRAGQFRAARNATVGTGRGTAKTVAAMSKLKTAVGSLKPRPKETAMSIGQKIAEIDKKIDIAMKDQGDSGQVHVLSAQRTALERQLSKYSMGEQAAATRASKGTSVARIQAMVKRTKSRIAAVEHSMHNNPLVGGVRKDRARYQSDLKNLKRLEATLARLNKLTRKREQRLPGYDLRTGGFIQD